jgi:hypothetical protein
VRLRFATRSIQIRSAAFFERNAFCFQIIFCTVFETRRSISRAIADAEFKGS